jgi:hypothetical protein
LGKWRNVFHLYFLFFLHGLWRNIRHITKICKLIVES